MTLSHWKRFWGTLFGAIAGWTFGQVNVLWAWLYEKELWPLVGDGIRIYDAQPWTARVMNNANIWLLITMFFGALLGFLVAYSLSSAEEKGEQPGDRVGNAADC